MSVDGKYEIKWKLTNDHPKAVTLSKVTIVVDKADTIVSPGTLPTSIEARPNGGPDTFAKFTSVVKLPATKVQVTYTATWSDGYHADVASNWVPLTGPCPSPSPSPSRSASQSPSPSASASTPATPSTTPTPSLPVTGTSSTAPLVGTGAALVLGGVALVATLRRRRRVTFTAE